MSVGLQLPLLVGWVVLLAAVFALLEIQIEGADGWAQNLPTWRRPVPRWLRPFWGGRPCTGYHVYLFVFMALVFHLPLFVGVQNVWRAEAQILGSLMFFWIVEDFLWFVFNPAYGLKNFRPGQIRWHPRWIGRVPLDYVIYGGGALFLLASSVALDGWGK